MPLFKDKNEDGLEVRLHATSYPVTDAAIAAFSGERGFDQGNDDVDDDMKNVIALVSNSVDLHCTVHITKFI